MLVFLVCAYLLIFKDLLFSLDSSHSLTHSFYCIGTFAIDFWTSLVLAGVASSVTPEQWVLSRACSQRV